MHGCFWHAHGCRHRRPPKSRLDYWLPKLARNKERDAEKQACLESLHWRVLTIWQCEIEDLDALAARLCAFLEDDGARTVPPSQGVARGGSSRYKFPVRS